MIERRWASDKGIIQSRHSRRIVPITRSQMESAFGLATGDRNTSTPRALIESSRCLAKIRSRVRGHVHMCQSARAVLDDNEDIEHPKRGRDADEEVARENALRVVLQE